MVDFKSIPVDVDPISTYDAYFGKAGIPDGSVYLWRNPRYGMIEGAKEFHKDLRAEIQRKAMGLEEGKALTTTSPLFATSTFYSATSGSMPVLLPEIVDSQIHDFTMIDTPLASGLIARVANRGLFSPGVRRTSLPTAVVGGETGALTAKESTYTKSVVAMKHISSTCEISGMMQAASLAWKNALDLELNAHYMGMKQFEEDMLINGNPTTADSTGAVTDARGFTGLINTASTNTTDLNDAEVQLAHIRVAKQKLIEDKALPGDLVAITDFYTFNNLLSRIQESFRYPAPTDVVNFGASSISIDKIPVIVDLKMPTTAGARECLVFDASPNSMAMRVLQDTKLTELASGGDSYKVSLISYEAFHPYRENRIYRIYDTA